MQVFIAVMGFLVTAMVVAGMILMAPGNTEPNIVEPDLGAGVSSDVVTQPVA